MPDRPLDDVEFRLARPDDLAWCLSFDLITDEAVVKWKIEHEELFLALAQNGPIGLLRLEYLWSKFPYIGMIRLVPEWRRQGMGTRLLAFTEAFLRKRGHEVLYSSSQADEPEPQAWHRAVGFEECGVISGINPGGIGEIFFRKWL